MELKRIARWAREQRGSERPALIVGAQSDETRELFIPMSPCRFTFSFL